MMRPTMVRMSPVPKAMTFAIGWRPVLMGAAKTGRAKNDKIALIKAPPAIRMIRMGFFMPLGKKYRIRDHYSTTNI